MNDMDVELDANATEMDHSMSHHASASFYIGMPTIDLLFSGFKPRSVGRKRSDHSVFSYAVIMINFRDGWLLCPYFCGRIYQRGHQVRARETLVRGTR